MAIPAGRSGPGPPIWPAKSTESQPHLQCFKGIKGEQPDFSPWGAGEGKCIWGGRVSVQGVQPVKPSWNSYCPGATWQDFVLVVKWDLGKPSFCFHISHLLRKSPNSLLRSFSLNFPPTPARSDLNILGKRVLLEEVAKRNSGCSNWGDEPWNLVSWLSRNTSEWDQDTQQEGGRSQNTPPCHSFLSEMKLKFFWGNGASKFYTGAWNIWKGLCRSVVRSQFTFVSCAHSSVFDLQCHLQQHSAVGSGSRCCLWPRPDSHEQGKLLGSASSWMSKSDPRWFLPALPVAPAGSSVLKAPVGRRTEPSRSLLKHSIDLAPEVNCLSFENETGSRCVS